MEQLLAQLAIFVIAAFLGWELIQRVPTLLHTPLMSATNAIHGIVLVGGFWVTHRMLGMFKPDWTRKKKS